MPASDLVYERLKEQVKELGCRHFSDNPETFDGANEISQLKLKGFAFYDGDPDPVILLNPNLRAEEKNHVMALLIAHATSFLGKDFKVDLMVLDRGFFLLQQGESVYERRNVYNVPALYKAHITEVAYSMIDTVKQKTEKEAA